MSIENITNYHFVSPSIASSGQPTISELGLISNDGYQLIINLAMSNSDQAMLDEGSIVAEFGMVYMHIPVPFNQPNTTHLKQFIKIMIAFSDHKIWVHCAANYRASAFLYQYHKLVLKQTEQQAKQVMLPTWQPNRIWQDFLQQTINLDD